MSRKYLIAGNWKMYKTIAEAEAFATEFKSLYKGSNNEVAIIAPYPQIATLGKMFADTDIMVGAQNMHYETEGAFTGEISPPMLKELGAKCVVIGHSERRQFFGETNYSVNQKLHTACDCGFLPIVCVGENLQLREAGMKYALTETHVEGALVNIPRERISDIVIAYEPVWAIGTGRTATPEEAEDMCSFIRKRVSELYDEEAAQGMRVLYGGSVKPDNAAELLANENIDGVLVGGASLMPKDFNAIIPQ